MNRRELEKAIIDEVAEWPGVSVEFIDGGTHPKAKLAFGDLKLSRAYPGTPSDSYNGLHRCLGDMRRVMKQLGAVRDKPEPSPEDIEARYSKPNDGREKRPDPVVAEKVAPKADVAEQLVDAGVVTVERAVAAKSSPRIVWDDDEPSDEDQDDDDAKIAAERARIQAAIDSIEDGIYFDLPDEIHHGVRALGSSHIMKLIISPGTFWCGSWLDPDRPELDFKQTDAQILGKAYHTARLEPDFFDARFCRMIDATDFPSKGFLASDAAMKAALKAIEQKQTIAGESIVDRAERLIDAGYTGTIFPLEKAKWKETVNGRTPIKAEFYDQILIDMERIKRSEIADLLIGGFAEVSIFWTDRYGIRCKARLDYLTFRHWVDFKSFDNSRGKTLEQAINDAFRFNRYYVQAVHYRDAVEEIRTGGVQIKGDATDAQRELIARIQVKPDDLKCFYVMQEKSGVPNLLGCEFEFYDVPANMQTWDAGATDVQIATAHQATRKATMIHQRGRIEIEKAKKDFALYSQVYEPGTPWSPIEPMRTIGDIDFSTYWLEGKS